MSDKNKRQAMKTSKLLPCPFCGGEAYLRKSDHGIVVYAEHSPLCYLSGTIPSVGYADVKTSIEVWNTRKPIDDIVEELKSEMFESSYNDEIEKEYWLGMWQGYRNAIGIIEKEVGA